MKSPKQNYLTVSQVARSLGRTCEGITKAIREGRLKAERFGMVWMISKQEFKKFRTKNEKEKSGYGCKLPKAA